MMSDQMNLQPTTPITPEAAEQDFSQQLEQQGSPVSEAQLALRIKRDNHYYKIAKVYASADNVPDSYRNKPGNCFIALQIADRIGMDVHFVMQNLTIIKGKPSWSGQACIALINGCGMFKGPVKFHWRGQRDSDDWGCYCTAISKYDNELQTGTLIDMNMVKGEGWNSNKKWSTMPEQMFKYRAASFFARTYCPNVLMGFSVEGELEDVEGAHPEKKTIKVE